LNFFRNSSGKKNAFISESYIGSHSDIGFFKADLISFTFAPNIKTTEPFGMDNVSIPEGFRGVWLNGTNILKRWQKIDICRELSKSKYENFIIGTDNDFEGNAMAKLLQLGLLNYGVEENRIVRVPLNYNGYKEVTPFWSNDVFERYLQDKWEDMSYVNHSKKVMGDRSGIGRRVAYMLSELLEPPEYVKNINANGSSTITYLFKKAINEK
jgi:hypothetical protein